MPSIIKKFLPLQLFHNLSKLVERSCGHTNLILEKNVIKAMTSDVFGQFGRPVYRFRRPNSGAQKNTYQVFLFSCISTKNTLSCD